MKETIEEFNSVEVNYTGDYTGDIGQHLRRIRRLKKLTQGRVAKDLQISQTHISCVEHNVKPPSFELFNRLLKYYNINVRLTCKIS